jgi:hypothetical protein
MSSRSALLELKVISQTYWSAVYRTPKRDKKNVQGVELKTDRLALLNARGAGTLDGGTVAALWLPAPDLVCQSICKQ